MDLSKDIMMDLGITAIGDIIAILKHAKQVYRQVRSVFHLLFGLLIHRGCRWCTYLQTDCHCYIFPVLHVPNKTEVIVWSVNDSDRVYRTFTMWYFCRTCAKWLQKRLPQGRPVLKLSWEEQPTHVSIYPSLLCLCVSLYLFHLTESFTCLFLFHPTSHKHASGFPKQPEAIVIVIVIPGWRFTDGFIGSLYDLRLLH